MKNQPITAKGPQDVKPMAAEDFIAAVRFVAKALLSDVETPKALFAGVRLPQSLDNDASKRLLAATFGHFKRNPQPSLVFYVRYKALVAAMMDPGMKDWMVRRDADAALGVVHPAAMMAAAEHPVLATGQFDLPSFQAAIDRSAGHVPDSDKLLDPYRGVVDAH